MPIDRRLPDEIVAQIVDRLSKGLGLIPGHGYSSPYEDLTLKSK